MAIHKVDEIRRMSREQRGERLRELKGELIRERAIAAAGGAPENPGRLREIKRTIARIKTVQNELEEQ